MPNFIPIFTLLFCGFSLFSIIIPFSSMSSNNYPTPTPANNQPLVKPKLCDAILSLNQQKSIPQIIIDQPIAPDLMNRFPKSQPIHSLTLLENQKKATPQNKRAKEKQKLGYFQPEKPKQVSSITLDIRRKSKIGHIWEMKNKISEKTIEQAKYPVCQRVWRRTEDKASCQQISFLGFIKQQRVNDMRRKMGSGGCASKKSANLILNSEQNRKGRNVDMQEQKQNKNEEATMRKSWLQDSIEYEQNVAPGPDHYNDCNLWPFQLRPGATFGTSQRFEPVRPRTAQLSYCNPSTPISSQASASGLVAFLTSKSNPRSGIKKVEYCDWIRPHFYQQVTTPNPNNKQHSCFQSAIQRFKECPTKTDSKFYLDSGHSNSINYYLPSYYFLSQVPKGINFITPKYYQTELRAQTIQNSTSKKLSKNGSCHPKSKLKKLGKHIDNKQIKAQIDRQIDRQIEIETRKNSLGNRRRMPCFAHKRKDSFYKPKQNYSSENDNKMGQANQGNVILVGQRG